VFSIDAQRLLAHLLQAWFGWENGQLGLLLTHYSSGYISLRGLPKNVGGKLAQRSGARGTWMEI
jgi:hypothetical protein